MRRSFADPDNITRDEFDELIGEAKEGTRPEAAFALGGAEALRKAFTSDDVGPRPASCGRSTCVRVAAMA